MSGRTPFSLLVACVIGIGVALGTGGQSAGAQGEWVAGNDGCAYLWNARLNGYEASMCFLAGGEISYYVASYGTWVWTANLIPQGNGMYLVWAAGSNGWVTACAPGYEASCASWSGRSSNGEMTGNAIVDQVLIDGVYGGNQVFLNGGIINCDYTYEC